VVIYFRDGQADAGMPYQPIPL